MKDVNETHLTEALAKLLIIRAWGVNMSIDPWAIRQALITVLAMDTEAALERGVDSDALFAFDEAAAVKAVEFIESIPK